jgi:hypothetical protein
MNHSNLNETFENRRGTWFRRALLLDAAHYCWIRAKLLDKAQSLVERYTTLTRLREYMIVL